MPHTALEYIRAAAQLLRQDPNAGPLGAAVELALSLGEPGASFADLLRARRTAAALSIADLSTRTGLAENTLRNLEAGRTVPARDSLALLIAVSELQLGAPVHLPRADVAQHSRPNAHLTARYDPTRMAQDLRAVVNGPGGTLEQSYLYLDTQSAADYLAVCDAYGSTRGKLFAELQAVAEQIEQPVDIVAIGSGDGRAEVCLAQALATRGRCRSLYLLDISHSLLTRAHEHAAAVLQPLGVQVEAVHGNFHELQRYAMLHAGPGKPRRLYTLLGATIANLTDELRFFRDLHSCSALGDLALIDYQLAFAQPEHDPALKAGTVPRILYDWQAGPLRRNNPDLQVQRIDLQPAPGRIPGSYVVVFVATAKMTDGATRMYRLLHNYRYDSTMLGAALAGTGWSTVMTTAYDERTAVMLLQRS